MVSVAVVTPLYGALFARSKNARRRWSRPATERPVPGSRSPRRERRARADGNRLVRRLRGDGRVDSRRGDGGVGHDDADPRIAIDPGGLDVDGAVEQAPSEPASPSGPGFST